MASKRKQGRQAANRRELQKRAERRREQGIASPVAAASSEPLKLRPAPQPNESPEDVAVFAGSAREKLSPERLQEADAVRDALELVKKGQFADAQERVKLIARTSPYADWRLFVRGLVAFYQQDLPTARQNWQRLDPTRRPARIANVLLSAEDAAPLSDAMPPPSKKRLGDARNLLQRKEVIAAARKIASYKDRSMSADETFSPIQFQMLMDFRGDFRKHDPEFVDQFSHACVLLVAHQPYIDVFDFVTSQIPGPPHDPRWCWLECSYFTQFSQDDGRLLDAVARLRQELESRPNGKQVGAALESLAYLHQAQSLQADANSYAMLPWMIDSADDAKIEKALAAAVKAYPAHHAAHRELIAHLTDVLDLDRCGRARKASVEKKLIKAKLAFVQACPDEVQLALEMIDHHFETGDIAVAKKIAAQLSQQRLEDPLARALPWKLKMHEIMQISRRKTELQKCHELLDEAEKLWPSWLDRRWFGFLRAALELRAGDQERYESLLAEARSSVEPSELLVDVMTFAALQFVNLPSPDLKPLRTRIDEHAKRAADIPTRELIWLAAFYWDLTRVGLRHKSYRLQTKAFGTAIQRRLSNKTISAVDLAKEFACWPEAFSWLAAHRYWDSHSYEFTREWISKDVLQHPRIIAAFFATALEVRFLGPRLIRYEPQLEILEQAARTEADPFYRYRFETIARRSREVLRRFKDPNRGRSPFEVGEEEDEEDNDEFDFGVGLDNDFDDTDDTDDIDDADDMDDMDLSLEEFADALDSADMKQHLANLEDITLHLGEEGHLEFTEVISAAKLQNATQMEIMDRTLEVFRRYGMDAPDVVKFFMAMRKITGDIVQHFGGDDDDESTPDPQHRRFDPEHPAPSADARRQSRRQRRNSVNKKTKKRKN